jgi:hypothetical protein
MTQQQIDNLTNKLIDLLGEDFDGKVGLRADSAEYLQVGSTLRNSINCDEHNADPEPFELDGTSAILISGDWRYDPRSVITKNIKRCKRLLEYANKGDVIAIIAGALTNNDTCDPGEVVISDAKVIALIDRAEIE